MNSTISTSVLFLGAPGLVGNHVIPALAEAGIPVLAGSRRGLVVGGAAGVTVDMRDPENLARTMQGIATVAFVIPDVIDMEVLGLNVVSAAQSAGVRRLLLFSSFGASPKKEARFSSRHPVIDEAVRSSGIRTRYCARAFSCRISRPSTGRPSEQRARFFCRWGMHGSVISICATLVRQPSPCSGTIGISAAVTI